MFKLRVYGNDGNLHHEFFVNYQAALHRWAALADRSEPWLIPTLWERQPDGGFLRIWG